MLRTFEDEIDRWWEFGAQGRVPPGRIVPVFGAGLSIDWPTGLPAGEVLTEALLRHFIDERAANEILERYKAFDHVAGRRVPRLEHLLSAAAKVNPATLGVLSIFERARPNRNHHLLAQHLMDARGWAITTNFDECVEAAAGHQLPVHLFDHDTGRMTVLNGPPDANWGLIKLHGTIAQGISKLGATLERLTPGLPTPVRDLIDQVLTQAQLVIVAGYSGSDHFDLNLFLRSKINNGYRARLLWIDHEETVVRDAPLREVHGVQTFRNVLRRAGAKVGRTSEILQELLGEGNLPPLDEPIAEKWRHRIEASFTPSDADRYRIGAALASAMGFATLAHEEAALLQREEGRTERASLVDVDACVVEGRWPIAIALLERLEPSEARIRRASILRAAGHPIWSLLVLFWPKGPKARDPMLARLAAAECLLDICRGFLHWPMFHLGLIRRAWSSAIGHHLSMASDLSNDRPNPTAEGHYQLLRLRQMAYCLDVSDGEDGNSIRRLIDEEVSYPELYINGKPAIPGFYLTTAVTARELDRLSDLLNTHLAFVDVLLACVFRLHLGWPALLTRAIRLYREGRLRHFFNEGRRIGAPAPMFLSTIQDQLTKAREIAEMLDEDHARTRVAKAWVDADRCFRGFGWWKRQRLYLGSRLPSQQETEQPTPPRLS